MSEDNVLGIILKDDEEVCEETLRELSHNRGDDEDE